jgi:hypothetical protein
MYDVVHVAAGFPQQGLQILDACRAWVSIGPSAKTPDSKSTGMTVACITPPARTAALI